VWLALAVSVVVSAPPAQGLTIRVPKPASFGATAGEADAVQNAVKAELEAEGYAVVTGPEDKTIAAVISGTLTRVGGGYILNLSIIRQNDGRVLDQVREEAKTTADLARASTTIAKQLASALRQAMGVRAKVKVK
jgi:rRNA maturation endonuclease Nob1